MNGAAARVLVLFPAHEMCHSRFTMDLANMAALTMTVIPDDATFGVSAMLGSTYIHSAREDLARMALEQTPKPTHLLWLDSDMSFPREALARLLLHNVDMVGINYSTRGFPARFVARKRIGLEKGDGERLVTSDDSTGLEEVEALGFGCVLMKTSVLERLPADKRWFWFEWNEKFGQQIGEDVYFCRLAREHGTRILVDHDLSKECAHLGSVEFTTWMAAGNGGELD
jgi:hypothetical protein